MLTEGRAQQRDAGRASHLHGWHLTEKGDALAQDMLLHHAPQYRRLRPIAACRESSSGHIVRGAHCALKRHRRHGVLLLGRLLFVSSPLESGIYSYGPWTLCLGMQVLLMGLGDIHDILQIT